MLEAITDGRTDLVFDYLAAGHAAKAADPNGVPLIKWCAYYGDVSGIKYLLERGEELSSLGDNLDLNGAAFHGHWRLCQYLIEQGADVNQPLPDTGETPLHATACGERPLFEHVVEVLLANGADPDRTTLHDVETGCLMRDVRTRGETSLHRAAAFGTERTIRLLLDAGATVEARDMHGDSPLSWASWHQRPAYILEMLCFGEHRVHPLAVERSRVYSSMAKGMQMNLLGEPHLGAAETIE